MARGTFTFILGTIGAAIGGPIGGTIGSALGSAIDNQVFPNKAEGPRLDDLKVTTSTYGKAIPLLYGPECRLAPNIIWSTGLIEVKKKSRQSGKGGPATDLTEYSYNVSVALAFSAREIVGIRKLWANGKVIYDDGSTALSPVNEQDDGTQAVFKTIRIYPGDFAQLPDPTIEAFMGAGNAPAYRGTAYCVLDTWELADYGNRIPNIEAFIVADEVISVGEVCVDIITRCGLDPLTASIPAGPVVRGYMVANEASGIGALQPLALAYDFDVAEVGGSLRLINRGLGPVASIESQFLAGHEQMGERPELFTWTRMKETDLPRESAFTYMDSDRDYQLNTQTSRRAAGSANNNLSTSVPVVLDATIGKARADRMLWEAWAARESGKTTVDDRFIGLEPGRLYCFETTAGWEALRLVRRTRGANGVIELELKRDRSEIYDPSSIGVRAFVKENVLKLPGPTELMLLDAPILADADDDTGFYFVVLGVGAGWRGADVKRSTDGGTTYEEVAPVGFEAIIGTADALAATQADMLDETSVLTVTLLDPTDSLDSVEDADIFAGANACWLGPNTGAGGEVLQFRDATEVSPGVWELTGLLRGRLGTEFAMAHGAGERFVLLEQGPLQRADYGAGDWNKVRPYKAVSLLTDESTTPSEDFTNTGEGKRPLAPVHVVPAYDGADVELTWVRRSRLRQPGIGNGDVALGEESESYQVDVLDGVTVVRTETVSTPALAYDAASIAADGFVGGDVIGFRVYQMSGSRGRGHPASGSVTI